MNLPVTIIRNASSGGLIALCACSVAGLLAVQCAAQAPVDVDLDEQRSAAEKMFKAEVSPFVKKYCIECHQNKRPTEAGVNFSPALQAPGNAAFSQQWKKAEARVTAHDMPPEFAEHQPSDAERQMFADWFKQLKYLAPKDPGPFVIRRLTKTEYANTLHDLFGVETSIADALPDDVSGAGYLNSLSPLQLEQYLSIAERVLESLLAADGDHPIKAQLLGFVEPSATEPDMTAAAAELARSLARKAFRRPASESEVDVLLQVFALARENGQDATQAARLMLKSILVSPQFLFITPIAVGATSESILPLDDYQLASRLSYLLWGTLPDHQLMTLADQGKLSEPAILRAQIKRVLDDPRARALFDGFGAQWLGLGDLQDRAFDPNAFPEMTRELREAMYDEARLFFESVVRENRRVDSFVDCDYTFLNETLAELYGMEASVSGPEMRRVKLTSDNRGGILGMPGVLAATSFPNRTSPVKRGVWVLEQVLGDNVPDAPPDIPALEEQRQETIASLTLRQRTELHRTDPVCANCHKMLDPIGFGLENFDAIGRWRDRDDNGAAIDAAGELPGGKRFSSPSELKTILAAQTDKLARNLVEKLLAYALCRPLEGYDEIVVDGLMKEIAEDEYRMQSLVTAVVTSYPFTHRRIQE